jgi:hypothetical protein
VQRLVNIEGFMPGKNFVILGSGDIGMIMARRLVLEGANVIKVIELMPYLTGLRRNYVQCLQDHNIPLGLSTTVKKIIGKNRVEAVETVKVDESLNFIEGTEEIINCDSLLLSVGLIPENELSKKAGVVIDPVTGGPVVDENMATNVEGIFCAGNVVTIYDLVDYVSMAGQSAGKNAALYAAGKIKKTAGYTGIIPGEGVRSVVPQKVSLESVQEDAVMALELRASMEFPEKITVDIMNGDNAVMSFRQKYARPAEMITLNVKLNDFAAKVHGKPERLKVRITKI